MTASAIVNTSSATTFGSLFAGIGGFDLGFERAGMVCKWQVEIDSCATKVLEKHWPNVHRERDIRQCGLHNLQRVDVICGGFPCQDISYAGHGAGLDGERSGLFFEAIRVVRQLRPKIVVLENVAALLTRGLDKVLGTLAQIGYDAEWHCIQAADVGAPHIRDRVFVLAYTKHGWVSQRRRAEDACEEGGLGRIQGHEREGGGEQAGSVLADAACELQHRRWLGSEQARWREFTNSGWWAVEPAVGRVADGVPGRVDRLRGLGNAVVPQVAEYIGKHVLRALQTPENSGDEWSANKTAGCAVLRSPQ